jgi:hypothetical protein
MTKAKIQTEQTFIKPRNKVELIVFLENRIMNLTEFKALQRMGNEMTVKTINLNLRLLADAKSEKYPDVK